MDSAAQKKAKIVAMKRIIDEKKKQLLELANADIQKYIKQLNEPGLSEEKSTMLKQKIDESKRKINELFAKDQKAK